MTRTNSLSLASALITVALLAAAPARAQTPQGSTPPAGDMRHRGPMMGRMRNPPSVDERVQRMSGELNLTPEQTTRMKALLTAGQRSADSLRAARAVQMEAEHKAMESRRAEQEKSLLAILTPEQKTKREALMKQHPGRDGRGAGGRHRGGPDAHRSRGDSDQRTR